VVPGAADGILQTLRDYGFRWDEDVLWQSQRTARYRQALALLRQRDAVFGCACSRKDLAAITKPTADAPSRYPGTCRQGLPLAYQAAGRTARSVRFRVDDQPIHFHDRLRGNQEARLESTIGDFVILRADGLFAYQLAVVVDDADQEITDVVRGADLLDNTARQVALQRALGCPTPRYLHVPVAVGLNGNKLSKQTGAMALRNTRAVEELVAALQFLGQHPQESLAAATLQQVWDWAQTHWRPEAIPATDALPAPAICFS
jgi:glutamyl-Q tRNA(Asp) synthetase